MGLKIFFTIFVVCFFGLGIYMSVRNTDYSRGVVNQLNEKPQTSDCSDNYEAIIELDNLQD